MAETTNNFLERFGNIQTSLKAPKNLRNTFGNYNYRNAEGILEAVKPYLKENRVILTLVDDVVAVGDRVFIKAEATLHDMDGEGYVKTTAFAQIDAHKGMSADQTTGCASSYARKYALNGLFLLDDTKDEDTDEFKKEQMAKGEAKTSAQPTHNQQTRPSEGMSRQNLIDYFESTYPEGDKRQKTLAWAATLAKSSRTPSAFNYVTGEVLAKMYDALVSANGTESKS